MCFAKAHARGFSLLEMLIAIALGAFICIGVFNLYSSLSQLSQRQYVISNFAENTRFLSDFLKNKINQAGDWSCLSRSPGSRSLPIKGFNSDQAKNKLGLTIKSGTELLQLHECIRLHNNMQYLPVEFFIADTYRTNALNQKIYALFFKVAHHPREELITGMEKFQLSFGVRDKSQHNIRAYHKVLSISDWAKVGAVKISYKLFNNDFPLDQPGVLYAGLWHQTK
jgi:prepilin-type N-terminal cleavage/methylation domain-containing protein